MRLIVWHANMNRHFPQRMQLHPPKPLQSQLEECHRKRAGFAQLQIPPFFMPMPDRNARYAFVVTLALRCGWIFAISLGFG